jgi:hypothetical protein
MKCPRCQQENPPQAKFCLECGVPIDGATASPKWYADPQGENEGLRRSLGEARAQVSEASARATATSDILRVISSRVQQPPSKYLVQRAGDRSGANRVSMLVRFQPRTDYPPHRHDGRRRAASTSR